MASSDGARVSLAAEASAPSPSRKGVHAVQATGSRCAANTDQHDCPLTDPTPATQQTLAQKSARDGHESASLAPPTSHAPLARAPMPRYANRDRRIRRKSEQEQDHCKPHGRTGWADMGFQHSQQGSTKKPQGMCWVLLDPQYKGADVSAWDGLRGIAREGPIVVAGDALDGSSARIRLRQLCLQCRDLRILQPDKLLELLYLHLEYVYRLAQLAKVLILFTEQCLNAWVVDAKSLESCLNSTTELPGGLEAGALLVSCAAGVLLAEGIDCGTLLGGE
eukprot:CAMPEP_0181199096 /NCGR_PEP_ID=MMETSP1096-20121128/16991_1 /TAXON_ID=156174 ORGANISM="Chrysochromulina ericina, Strain CCMP281" /NCGR_SAMPLE_ID=MMETSP1096 /ASSEMBLY_ACC=CAM_ASM_000453 /LENGTH=277 /DNA_ID=CAMNT_0023289249 /DNA_START=236 /DNA_END=1072 /DNA_ORIENTATION=-